MDGWLIGLLCSIYFKNRCTFSVSLQFIIHLYPSIEGLQPRLTPLCIYAVRKPGVTQEIISMSWWPLPPSRADVPGHPAKWGQTVASHGSSWVCKYKPISCMLNKDCSVLLDKEITITWRDICKWAILMGGEACCGIIRQRRWVNERCHEEKAWVEGKMFRVKSEKHCLG